MCVPLEFKLQTFFIRTVVEYHLLTEGSGHIKPTQERDFCTLSWALLIAANICYKNNFSSIINIAQLLLQLQSKPTTFKSTFIITDIRRH